MINIISIIIIIIIVIVIVTIIKIDPTSYALVHESSNPAYISIHDRNSSRVLATFMGHNDRL